jgi:neutral ceramidase
MPTSFKVGAAKADITLADAGRVMAGYAYDGQRTSGAIDLRLQARAFYVEENRNSPRTLCLVVIDAWGVPEPIKSEVLDALRAQAGNKLNRANLVISATHTHAGPGGYANHFLYNLANGGCDRALIDKMVSGIVSAITQAKSGMAEGHIYLATGDLVDCGDNRSISAYRKNPESTLANGFDRRTDREMTVLKFVQNVGSTHKEIGLYSIFAIHPTSLGTNNLEISGDNKGWAAKFCEDTKGAGFIAAFANGSAGDVSPNVTVSNAGGNWTTRPRLPIGGPDNVAALAADKQKMKDIGQLQSDKALALFASATTELTGRLASRCTHKDLSNVAIAGQAGKRTWSAALGASFAAGSREDNKPLIKLVLGLTFSPQIEEGINATAFAQGKTRTESIVGASKTAAIEDASNSLQLGLAALSIAFKIDDIKDDAMARSWTFPTAARTIFIDVVEGDRPQPTTHLWKWNVPHRPNWPVDFVAGQGMKPIMWPVGLTQLKRKRGIFGNWTYIDTPIVPHVIPLQIAMIGSCAIAALPSEFSTVAGYRLKDKIKSALGSAASHVALAGYSNDYAFYVTTPEEYDVQNYEGASTLYGPHTLAAFLQETAKLAQALKTGIAVTVGAPKPPAAIYYRR